MSDCGLNWKPASECRRCARLVASRSQIVLPTPCPTGGLLAIGEAPGEQEDRQGEGFVGQAGRTLDAMLRENGLSRGSGYGVANIVRCRPEGNRKPDKAEIENCLPGLARFLLDAEPSVLLLVGATATEVFLGKGPLDWQIERAGRSPLLLAKGAHPILQPAIRLLHQKRQVIYAVPMPHTSGMIWHRKAPDGRPWREIGAAQVRLACDLLEACHAD